MQNKDIALLDECHFHFDPSWRTSMETVDAGRLLGRNRFDLYAILLYIDQRMKGVTNLDYALEAYRQRTYVLTGYTYREKGNERKNSFEDFVAVLDDMIESFKNDEFDIYRTLVPVDSNYVIMDGAHRVCCAAYFGKQIRVLRFVDKDFNQHVTSAFLLERALPINAADAMALEYCRWHKNIFMLFLWPKAHMDAKDKLKADELIDRSVSVVYRKTEKMTYNGVRNLMIQIYSLMDWIGTVDNDFHNTYVKADEVWHKNGRVEFILIEAPSCEDVLALKQGIRDVYQMGLATIHSTDTYEEALMSARLVYNPNSMHHLNVGHPTKFKKSHHLVEKFHSNILSSGMDPNRFIVDSSMVLSMYGVREASDLDYYSSLDNTEALNEKNKIDNHESFIGYHAPNTKEDLIWNPGNYFIYHNLKFVSLPALAGFKKNRNEKKDINDLHLIQSCLDRDSKRLSAFYFRLRNDMSRKKIILKRNTRKKTGDLLRKMHLLTVSRSLYHKIKRG